jgi:DhnA family fructose-bisphosphate aldolase class Ia
MMYPWKANEPDSLANVARLAAECRKWGMPLLVETVPGGFEAGPEMRTPEKIAAAARIGVEMGADFIKTFFTTERFDVVTHNVPVPIVILGGEKAASERDLLESVKKAMDAGAKGVAIGRNIWQHAHPDRITAAIAAIVHGNATVEQALKELG